MDIGIPETLDATAIRAALDDPARSLLSVVEILDSVDSTNDHLLAAADHGRPSGSVCLAETQTAGRGRRGRHWVSPPGGNLYLSLLWRYPVTPTRLASLGIATGLAVARALQTIGARDIQLKWPNDLLWQGRKLGGLLLETRIGGDCVVVAGIGLNVRMSRTDPAIDQPWVDLTTVLDRGPDRNRPAAALLNRLLPMYRDFPHGRDDIPAAWAEFDALADRPVEIEYRDERLHGMARGIDANGQLRVETAQGPRLFSSGALSVRATG